MIQNKRVLNHFYKKLIQKEHLSYKQALSLYEALHREALSLGVFTSKNILEGLETDIRVARMLRHLKSV